MTTTNAVRCDATGCKEKTFETVEDGFVPKGWTHGRITTRVGVFEVDFCEKHSAPLNQAIEQAKTSKA